MKIVHVPPFQRVVIKHRLQEDGVFPVFIVAVPRSGTTALSKALNQHSRIVMAPGESPLAYWFGKIGHRYHCGANSTFYQKYTVLSSDSLRSSLRQLCFDSIWERRDRLAIVGEKLNSPEPGKLSVWGTKAFPDEEAAEGLQWLFPNTKFIYIYRNGIDVVFSMSKFHSFRHLPFANRCQFWADHTLRYEYLRHHESSLVIRFEDFVQDPEPVLTRVCDHLGVPIEQGPLAFVSQWMIHPLDEKTMRGNPKAVLASRPPAYSIWSSAERELFRSICGDAMELLDYEIPF
jgi:hypothetical protein